MITLTDLQQTDAVSSIPTVFNGNFQQVKAHIDDIEELLSVSTSTLKLTDVTTIPSNSIESSSITLSGSGINSIVINPSGGGATLTISSTGYITCVKLIASGTGVNKSVIQDLDIAGILAITGDTSIDATLDLTGTNSLLLTKIETKIITDANCGGTASNPINASKSCLVLLDYDNSGVALGNDAKVKIDITTLSEGQTIKFMCLRDNATGQRLYNGTSGAEIFCYIDPNAAGITLISYTVSPEFVPNASPDNQSWLIARWTDIGGGVMRFLILDSQNVDNIS